MPIPHSMKARRQFWKRHVKAWRLSGLPQARYCRLHGLHPRTFFDWARKFPSPGFSAASLPPGACAPAPMTHRVAATSAGPELVPIPSGKVSRVSRPGAGSPKIVVSVGHRFRVSVGPDVAPAHLATVIRTLEAIR